MQGEKTASALSVPEKVEFLFNLQQEDAGWEYIPWFECPHQCVEFPTNQIQSGFEELSGARGATTWCLFLAQPPKIVPFPFWDGPPYISSNVPDSFLFCHQDLDSMHVFDLQDSRWIWMHLLSATWKWECIRILGRSHQRKKHHLLVSRPTTPAVILALMPNVIPLKVDQVVPGQHSRGGKEPWNRQKWWTQWTPIYTQSIEKSEWNTHGWSIECTRFVIRLAWVETCDENRSTHTLMVIFDVHTSSVMKLYHKKSCRADLHQGSSVSTQSG